MQEGVVNPGLLELPRPAKSRREWAAGCEWAAGREPAGRRGPTLEDRLEEAWRDVHADGETECPVCRASMKLHRGSGRCGGCGSRLY